MLRSGASIRLLKQNAVPSVFNFPQRLIKIEKVRRQLIKHDVQTKKINKKEILQVCL